MTSDELARERLRFWRSAARYYQARCQYQDAIEPSDELAYERAKEDLLRVAKREKAAPPEPQAEPSPETFRHKCPACGILQAEREVCEDCVHTYGSAEQAMARKREDNLKYMMLNQTRAKHTPSRARTEIREAKEERDTRLYDALRKHLAKYGALHAPTMALMLGVSKNNLIIKLHDVEHGADGRPPIKIIPPRTRGDPYWRVAK